MRSRLYYHLCDHVYAIIYAIIYAITANPRHMSKPCRLTLRRARERWLLAVTGENVPPVASLCVVAVGSWLVGRCVMGVYWVP